MSIASFRSSSNRRLTRRRDGRRRLRHEPLESRRLLAGGASFVDANHDGAFDMGDGDVLLNNGELNDGTFDTAVAEGPNYTTPIPGAGLVIQGAPITAANINFTADDDLTVKTDLTASLGTLKLTSRTEDVDTLGSALTAKNLIQLDAGDDVRSTNGQYLVTNPSSVIDIDAVDEITLNGQLVDAKKTVTMDSDYLYMGVAFGIPTEVNALPSSVGKVELHAYEILSDAVINASKDIVIDGTFVDLNGSSLIADGHGLAKIDIHGYELVDASQAEIFARKQINIESTAEGFGGVAAIDSYIEAFGGGSTSVNVIANGLVDISGSDLLATTSVSVEAQNGPVFANFSYLDANYYSNGTVSVVSNGGSGEFEESLFEGDEGGEGILSFAGIHADYVTALAFRNVIFDSEGSIDAIYADIEATGTSGSVQIDAVNSILLDVAIVQAGNQINITAGDGVLAFDAFFQACGRASSKVMIHAGGMLDLNGTTVRANLLIDLFGATHADVRNASIGISRAGAGDIVIESDLISVDGAVLKAPDDLLLLGTVDGVAADTTPGTLPCEDPFIDFDLD